VRARFHLALALALQGKAADARPLVETVLAAQPEHAAAKALVGKLETMVARTDPLPPESTPDGAKDVPRDAPRETPRESSAPKNPAPPRTNPVAPVPEAGGDSYDRLLARANAIADSNCGKAMELYAKALEQKPNGVEALAGMGYCHIDAKQFASAFSKFRAALAVSARYEPALRGVAEAYQQQGRREQAIEAYRAYLEVYPNSAAAKKQLELLGGDTQAPAASGNATPPAAAPPAAPPPAAPPAAPSTPPPAPPADPGGAGSGSG
jgi:tetratricopeptide (TPR) repeat protein